MSGGGGGLLGGITSLLFGKPKDTTFEAPEVEAPAPPAPSRKTDTGAIVKTGTDALEKNRRVSGATTTKRSLSSLGRLGRGSGLGRR